MPDAEGSSPEVRHNAEGSRYEISLDGHLAGFADYRADAALIAET